MQHTNDTPRCFAVIGDPIHQSLSPRIHTASYRAQKIHATYLPILVAPQDVKRVLTSMLLMDVDGCNVTTPHKQTILPYLDRLDPPAKIAGSVNTIYRRGKQWIGTNTDGAGFLQACKERKISLRHKTVTLLGAGGAASAIAASLMSAGVKHIIILNRTIERSKKLVARLKKLNHRIDVSTAVLSKQNCQHYFSGTDILINATSQGMKSSSKLGLPLHSLPSDAAICDCQYSPKTETALIRWAKRKHHSYMDGRDLLLHQAAASYQIWIGHKPDLKAMKRALSGAKDTPFR